MDLTEGLELYNSILTSVHKGDIQTMYDYLYSKNNKLELYGDTIEKRLINYCSFKRHVVLHTYGCFQGR